jgi:hypothetical protein
VAVVWKGGGRQSEVVVGSVVMPASGGERAARSIVQGSTHSAVEATVIGVFLGTVR